MTKYQIVIADEEDIPPLALDMRQQDQDEVWASNHMNPTEALQSGLKWSDPAYVGLVDGHPVCMFGVVNVYILAGLGVPWLLTTNEMTKHSMAFLRRNKAWLDGVKKRYSDLANFVDARNKMSIRWLGWLGFTIHPAEPYGLDQLPFHRFDLEEI